MKKVLRYFIIGVIILTLLMGTAIGETITQTIQVVYNSVNLTVNGTKIQADNILYNGTTYVPLRAVSEALGKEVGWDQATMTASINNKKTTIPDGVKLYEDEKVKISYLQLTSTGMEFMVENKTDVVLTIQADTIAVNGLNVSGYITMSDDVSPQSKGKVTANFSTVEFTDEVKTISGQLRIVDFDNMLDSYNAKFVNVEIK